MGTPIKFDREIIRWIAKSKAEEHPTTGAVPNLMLPAQGYGLVVVSPDADVSDLRRGIEEVYPGARIIEVAAPEGKQGEEGHREFMSALLATVGKTPAPQDTIEEVENSLASTLYPATDAMIITHAERLGVASLNALRRYHGMPPVVLIAYSDKILETLQKDILLLRNVYFFQTGA